MMIGLLKINHESLQINHESLKINHESLKINHSTAKKISFACFGLSFLGLFDFLRLNPHLLVVLLLISEDFSMLLLSHLVYFDVEVNIVEIVGV